MNFFILVTIFSTFNICLLFITSLYWYSHFIHTSFSSFCLLLCPWAYLGQLFYFFFSNKFNVWVALRTVSNFFSFKHVTFFCFFVCPVFLSFPFGPLMLQCGRYLWKLDCLPSLGVFYLLFWLLKIKVFHYFLDLSKLLLQRLHLLLCDHWSHCFLNIFT